VKRKKGIENSDPCPVLKKVVIFKRTNELYSLFIIKSPDHYGGIVKTSEVSETSEVLSFTMGCWSE